MVWLALTFKLESLSILIWERRKVLLAEALKDSCHLSIFFVMQEVLLKCKFLKSSSKLLKCVLAVNGRILCHQINFLLFHVGDEDDGGQEEEGADDDGDGHAVGYG